MGVYAQTHFSIECENKKASREVIKALKEMKDDEHGNTFAEDVSGDDSGVSGFMSSGRYQNLEYRCEKVWEAVRVIDGVIQAGFPFLSEADGMYFEKTEIKA
jgi:hypothetical protein